MPETDLKRADFEDYFLMWDSVIFYPNPAAKPGEVVIHDHRGEITVLPCHKHRSCGALVRAHEKYPPRVCPGCSRATPIEFLALSVEAQQTLREAVFGG